MVCRRWRLGSCLRDSSVKSMQLSRAVPFSASPSPASRPPLSREKRSVEHGWSALDFVPSPSFRLELVGHTGIHSFPPKPSQRGCQRGPGRTRVPTSREGPARQGGARASTAGRLRPRHTRPNPFPSLRLLLLLPLAAAAAARLPSASAHASPAPSTSSCPFRPSASKSPCNRGAPGSASS